jgi:hypothetical protein
MPTDTPDLPILFARHGHGAIGGIPPMCDLTRITRDAGGERFVMTAVGHLEDGALIEAFALGGSRATFRLKLIGEAGDRAPYNHLFAADPAEAAA